MSHSDPENDPLANLHAEKPGPFPVKAVAGVALFALAAFGVAYLPHHAKNKEAGEFTERTKTQVVRVVSPEVVKKLPDLVLPGSVSAYRDAPVFARTGGYLKQRKVDIGAHVKAGDLLAEIDVPEIDAQLLQARAAYEHAKADSALAKSTAERIRTLQGSNAVSKQEIDDKNGEALAKNAAEAAAQAEVVRLEQLVSFRTLVAPFDGIITERTTDIGDLINPGATTARPLFRVADLSKLRVFVNVPEADAAGIAIGDKARVEFTATPGVAPEGAVVRTAGAIDPASRTLLVEIGLKNEDGKLLPGGYARVTLPGKGASPSPVVPINTVFYRGKSQVGVVKPDGLVELREVVLGRNYGSRVEITGGLVGDEKIILNPPDSLIAGMKVEISPPPPAQ